MAMFATKDGHRGKRRRGRNALSAAKVQIGRSARLIGQQAVQLHGGIGMTMELRSAITQTHHDDRHDVRRWRLSRGARPPRRVAGRIGLNAEDMPVRLAASVICR